MRAMLKLIAVAVVLAACGDNLGGISLDVYAQASSDAACAHAVACGDVASTDACLETSLGQPLHITATQRAAIAAGTMKFDGGAAQTCLASLASRSCDVTSQANRVLPDPCFAIFLGTRGDGEACAASSECISQVCDAPVCDTACCTGTCIGGEAPVRAQIGESCEAARCEDNAFCDPAFVCTARRSPGSSCIFANDCQFGLDCDPDGVCSALPGPGQRCDGACRDEGTTCSAASQTCEPVAVAGEPCTMTSDCSVLYVCDANKRCSAGIALGDVCIVGQRCADPGAFCDAEAGESLGLCAPLRQLDEPCTDDSICESHACGEVTQRCVDEPVCIAG